MGTVITLLLVGLIVGALARLVIPGRNDMPVWLTILIGVGGALIGGLIANAVGIDERWLAGVIGIAVAAGIILLTSGMTNRSRSTGV